MYSMAVGIPFTYITNTEYLVVFVVVLSISVTNSKKLVVMVLNNNIMVYAIIINSMYNVVVIYIIMV